MILQYANIFLQFPLCPVRCPLEELYKRIQCKNAGQCLTSRKTVLACDSEFRMLMEDVAYNFLMCQGFRQSELSKFLAMIEKLGQSMIA